MLYIHGIGHFHPETVIDNAFFESLDIGTSNAWIVDRVGIHERRTVLPLDYIRDTRNDEPRAAHEASIYTNAETGARAAQLALERAGLNPSDIGMVIAGGCSPQYLIPAEACIIAAELGIDAPAIDVNSACSSFIAHLRFLSDMRPDTAPEFTLIVNVENTTRTVNYRDRGTAVLWGDGSSAAVVSHRVPARVRVHATTFTSDPSGWTKVRIPAGGFFDQSGPAVQAFAIRKTTATVKELMSGLDAPALPEDHSYAIVPSRADAAWFIGHQANLTMLQSAADRAGLDVARHLYNVDRFGNCGAAGAPSVLSQNWDRFADGDVLAIVTVGSGLSWGGALIKFDGETA
ncbi:MAG: ketoacyl-ACP synthase III [Gemmatimonadota bacterium]